jgi:ATP-dependent Lon protease
MRYEYDPDYVPSDDLVDEDDEDDEYDEDLCDDEYAYNEYAYYEEDADEDDGEEDDDNGEGEADAEQEDDSEDDEDNDDDEEESSEEEETYYRPNQNKPNIMLFINSAPMIPQQQRIKRERSQSTSPERQRCIKRHKYDDIMKKYNKHERAHFEQIGDQEKDELYQLEKVIENNAISTKEPLRFKFLKLNISNTVKNIIISKLEQLNKMIPCSGEYFKLSNWINTLSMIPIGKYHTLPISNGDGEVDNVSQADNNIAKYLQGIKRTIDDNIFGHEETKDQIIRILAQWISNPKSNGYVIGIQGSPGVGKTKLIKEGICKAMEYPFSFVSLGGISDASYLNGHHYTYEGATHGKIIECLIKARVMNPVFLFDELDKVSNTSRGDEIINTLIHITDPVQNDRFTDKYFEEIDLDLSKSLIIFTYNDENAINPILKDRMITIKVNGYNAKEKLSICKNYILPELLPQYNMKTGDVTFDDGLLKNIIDTHGKEEGVRSLKRIINDILSSINMMKYIPTDGVQISFPFQVTSEFYNKYCTKFEVKRSDIVWSMYT